MIDPWSVWENPPIPMSDRDLLARAHAVKATTGSLPDGMWYECFMRSTQSPAFVQALTAIQPAPEGYL